MTDQSRAGYPIFAKELMTSSSDNPNVIVGNATVLALRAFGTNDMQIHEEVVLLHGFRMYLDLREAQTKQVGGLSQ